MGFQHGLSGLMGASKDLQVIGNNIANTSTVGFKLSNAQFSDLYAKSMNLSGTSPGGIGVAVATIAQQFTQGDLVSTANPLDIAINGDGFFRMIKDPLNNNEALYTRNGQFQLDKEGYIVNKTTAGGAYLTGWPTGVKGGDPSAIRIDTSALPATQSTSGKTQVNLDSRKEVIDQTTTPFNVADGESYHDGSGVTIYDSLGNTYNVQTFYVKTAAGGTPPTSTWKVYATVDGVPTPPVANAGDPHVELGTLTFDSNGVLTTVTPTTPPATPTQATSFVFAVPGKPGASDFNFEVNYVGSTQTAAEFVNLDQTQNGNAPGILLNFGVDSTGKITGSYSNGEFRELGQVLLVNFANPNGLTPQGDNVWRASSQSGEPVINVPGRGRFGTLRSSTVESSNVDMTVELVNMIIAQRVYQANAQTIKTQDSVMNTLVNMR
jgi:flagellar hook protein FlgE